MHSSIFPTGLILDLPKLDLEMLLNHLQQWDLEAQQMQKGKFYSKLYAIHTPRIQLHDTFYSHGFLTRGDFPENCFMLAYVKTNAKVVFQNRVLENNELVISTNGDEVDYISNGKNEIYSIIVEKNLFLEAFFQYYGEPFKHFETQNRFFIKPYILHHFIKRIIAWMSFLKLNQSRLLAENKYAMIESDILTDIFDCLMIKKVFKNKKGFKIKEARDFLHTNLNMDLNSMTIAKEFGISQRHMERLFKINYGISPKRYLLNIRMNAVRKELLLSHPKETTVSSIILKYNFFDLNYFTKAYKLMYHELPSQTLHR